MGPRGEIYKNKSTGEVFETELENKQLEKNKVDILSNYDSELKSFTKTTSSNASFSEIPRAAATKNGGILGFFKKKKDIQVRNALNNNAGPQVVDGRINRAIVDLTDAEREGRSVTVMRHEKNIFAMKAEEDLKRDDLSQFTRDILENIQKLGNTDFTLFSGSSKRMKERKKEDNAAKACIPFLIKFIEDIDKIESEGRSVDEDQEFQQKYNQITQDEQHLLRIYAELTWNMRGTLDTQDVPLQTVPDTQMRGLGEKVINDPPQEDAINKRSEMKFESKKDVPLFNHIPCIYDMKQGDFGDCYLISSLISIVNADPKTITSSMKDNGDTVTVRFYSNGRPVYVTVEKTIPYREYTGRHNGQDLVKKEYYGAKGALWVSIMEKAYTVFKYNRNYLKIDGQGSDGASTFIKNLTGREEFSNNLLGNIYNPRSYDLLPAMHDIKNLMHTMRKTRRAEFEARLRSQNQLPNTTRARNALWNKEKARLFFGITAQEYDEKNLSEMFRKNRAFSRWTQAFKTKIKQYTDSGVRTLTELRMLIDDLKPEEFPTIGIEGIDEKRIRDHYLNYMYNYFIEKKTLFSIGNNYEYDEDETDTFNMIKNAKTRKLIVTAGTNRLRFSREINGKIEGNQAGIHGNHVYSVLGATQKTVRINGHDFIRKFVILNNPWGHSSRLYDSDGVGFDQETVIDNTGNILYNNHGVFLCELREFNYLFSSIEIQ